MAFSRKLAGSGLVSYMEGMRDASATLLSHDGFQMNGQLGYYAMLTRSVMNEQELLKRITVNPKIFGGKPIIRGRRLAVEHILRILAAGDTAETILQAYPLLEKEDIQACLVYSHR